LAAPGKLYVVATPIGNLGDLSPRAAQTLAEVDVVAAEDTRVTRRLLTAISLHARLVSYREHNERRVTPGLVEQLLAGHSVALVSDAGTPTISDPGLSLVAAAAAAGVEVVAVPGPSAVVSLLSVSGLPTDRFSFEGFLPARSGARQRAIRAWPADGRTIVVYESPRRVIALLSDLETIYGDPRVAAGRELTKLYEEVLRGRASQVRARLEQGEPRGEFCVAVYVEAAAALADEAEAEARELLDTGLPVREVVARLKGRIPHRRIYELARSER
jgi:16S rRNA (cytidine1402-2'-O)-methyltransferase